MKIKEVRKNALDIYKSHPVNSWIISIICGLFLAALSLIGMLSELLVIILLPLLVLPFFFACAVSHLSLREKDELTFRNLFGFYRLFFRPPFNSSFSAIKSFFKALLCELVLSFIATWICFAAFSSSSETFTVTINQLAESLSDMSITAESFQAALEANNNELGNFLSLTNGINAMLFGLAFIFFIAQEEITIYLRLKTRNIPLANQIARASIRANSKNYHKAFFALNWPLFLIITLGMVGGCFLSIYAFHNYDYCGVIGLAMGIGVTVLFLPFYFANMEAIEAQLAIDISSFSEEYVKNVFKKYGVDVEISEHDTEESVDGHKKDSDDTESK